MGRIVRRGFVGSKFIFWLLCVLGITLPIAIVYLIDNTVTVEEEMANPTLFLENLRAGRRIP
jgi:hypothetical protein